MLRSPNRVAAIVIGALALALGIGGVISTLAHPAAREEVFGVFAANLLQALIHLMLGAGIAASGLVSARAARFAAQLGGTLLLALGIAGLFLVDTGANVLALGASDNLAHFCGAAVLLTIGFGAERPRPET